MKKHTTNRAGPSNFDSWLTRAKVTDDPAGDLIADIRRDPEFPRNISSRKSLERYLSPKACDGAIRAIPQVWNRYTNWRKDNPCPSSPTSEPA